MAHLCTHLHTSRCRYSYIVTHICTYVYVHICTFIYMYTCLHVSRPLSAQPQFQRSATTGSCLQRCSSSRLGRGEPFANPLKEDSGPEAEYSKTFFNVYFTSMNICTFVLCVYIYIYIYVCVCVMYVFVCM